MSKLEIRMQAGMIDCSLCGEPDDHRWGVPTCNGDVVSNDFPDHLWQGSVAVCEQCFNLHAEGKIPTFDRYYWPQGFVGGDGI